MRVWVGVSNEKEKSISGNIKLIRCCQIGPARQVYSLYLSVYKISQPGSVIMKSKPSIYFYHFFCKRAPGVISIQS